MYVLDFEYLVPAADSSEHDRLPEPVRKREPDSHRGAGHCGDRGEYGGGNHILQGDGQEPESVGSPVLLLSYRKLRSLYDKKPSGSSHCGGTE